MDTCLPLYKLPHMCICMYSIHVYLCTNYIYVLHIIFTYTCACIFKMGLPYNRVAISTIDITDLHIKSPLPGMGYLFWNSWPAGSNRPQNITGNSQCYCLLPEPDSKILLLNMEASSLSWLGSFIPTMQLFQHCKLSCTLWKIKYVIGFNQLWTLWGSKWLVCQYMCTAVIGTWRPWV